MPIQDVNKIQKQLNKEKIDEINKEVKKQKIKTTTTVDNQFVL